MVIARSAPEGGYRAPQPVVGRLVAEPVANSWLGTRRGVAARLYGGGPTTRRTPWFEPPVGADRHILNPFDASDAISVTEPADIAGRSAGTVHNRCRDYCIGRRIAGSKLAVSRAALQLLLDGDGPLVP